MKIPFILIVLLNISNPAEENYSPEKKFEFEITNIQNKGGQVNIAVYDSESGWMDTPFKTKTLKTDKDAETVSFEVPYGTYAISVYQDVNGNGELDTNFMGIPKEPIAFGNNFKPFGKPKFKDAAINFNSQYQVQSLKLYNIL
ncbi:DUF2141 domain-containing protein [Robertkochia aurantiaca]|uniref:DUF2141 domain-containing protein n=1 Tax=Robertkochia aurantiaca TaxID=2873700 RepID=UPI001CC9C61D|nr:DUF2141 domain-containing protein [Robertkochia sp. 3YJGBD-33]